jgi:hypothetical protein
MEFAQAERIDLHRDDAAYRRQAIVFVEEVAYHMSPVARCSGAVKGESTAGLRMGT